MKKLFVFMAFAMMVGAGVAGAQEGNITLEDIWTRRTFSAKGVYGIRSMADGEHYCTMSREGIAQYRYASGEKVRDLCLFVSTEQALPSFESYVLSDDESLILLSSGFEPLYRHSGVSDYWLYNIKDKTYTLLTRNGKQRLTTLSPDGTKTAFVRDNNLYWMDLATLEEHQITADGQVGSIINGTTDWVYEEEFAITRGFQWSPDSKMIAYLRFDESGVREYNMQMWGEGDVTGNSVPSSRLYPADYRYKYPKAGEDNSQVSLHIYSVARGEELFLPSLAAMGRSGAEWEYLPRFQWAGSDGVLAFMRMNRLQNHLQIVSVSTADGSQSTILYEEEDAAYVEVPDTWQFIALGRGKKALTFMLLTSERSGYRHAYLYDLHGSLVSQITSGDYEICEVAGVDTKGRRLYYTSREDGAINKSLYVVGLDGKKKRCLNYTWNDNGVLPLRVAKPFGMDDVMFKLGPYILGNYSAAFSAGCKYYICTYSNANTAPIYTLHNASGKTLKVLEDNAALQQKMADYGTGRKQFGTFTTGQGTKLNCYMITPKHFDKSKRHPVLIYVYGGPGNQQVSNSYGYSDYYWYHMLAEKGYVVMCFDGRGTGGRGAGFKKQTYEDMGHRESEDAIEAARWLGQQSWVDKDRIGIWGWSFGGYLSTLSLLKGNDVFKSAIAVAPVMSWRYYDNIYTERFLGLPKDNPDGYDDNSPLNFADQLKGNYLLIHGTGDDNVHFQNSAEMVERLENAGKQFEFRIYPNKNHSIYDATGNTRLNLYQLMTDFIERKL